MFLRVKKVKGKEYCYLVENKKSGQKVKKYLGAAVRLESKKGFFDRAVNGKAEDILRGVVLWELAKAGFAGEEKMVKDDVVFNNMRLRRSGKKVVLAINDGYLCDFTLKRILAFRRSRDIESDSLELARRFVDAGLGVPKDAFVAVYHALG